MCWGLARIQFNNSRRSWEFKLSSLQRTYQYAASSLVIVELSCCELFCRTHPLPGRNHIGTDWRVSALDPRCIEWHEIAYSETQIGKAVICSEIYPPRNSCSFT